MATDQQPSSGRRRGRAAVAEPKPNGDWADGEAPSREALGELLRLLPEKQREILVLRVVVGLSAEETAEAVGSTPGAVRVAQHRALGRLRKEITALAVPIG